MPKFHEPEIPIFEGRFKILRLRFKNLSYK